MLFAEDGRPLVPKISIYNNYLTKNVQTVLRKYCTEHIREQSTFIWTWRFPTYSIGFKTGKTKQIIYWGSLMQDPNTWINEDCTPPGFEWKDPSKIQILEIYQLLDYWMDCEAKGLDALIWVPSCPLLQNAQDPRKRWQGIRQARASQEQESDEENFVLPSSGNPNDADDEYGHRNQEEQVPEDPGSEDMQMDTSSAQLYAYALNRRRSGAYLTSLYLIHMTNIETLESGNRPLESQGDLSSANRSSALRKYIVHF